MQRNEYQAYIIQRVMLLSRQWEHYLNRRLRDTGITFPQFTVLATIEQFGKEAPTVGSTAEALLMSHQNVMRLVKPLQRNGFVEVEKDKADRRVLRLHLTRTHFDFWAQYQERSKTELEALYQNIDDKKLDELYTQLGILLDRATNLRKTY